MNNTRKMKHGHSVESLLKKSESKNGKSYKNIYVQCNLSSHVLDVLFIRTRFEQKKYDPRNIPSSNLLLFNKTCCLLVLC